jgi:hypothetical protein
MAASKVNYHKLFIIVVILAAIGLAIMGKMLNTMFILWPNTILFVVVGLLLAVVGFIIYGLFKGFENTFPND